MKNINEMQIVKSNISTPGPSELDQQIAAAKVSPRLLPQFRNEVTAAVTFDESSAKECIYVVPRGGKTIEGPSIRFAELIGYAWGNLHLIADIVNEGEEFVTAQGVFHDLEKNLVIVRKVHRRIIDSKGKRYNPDMIGITANAACSIAMRNAILHGIPKMLWLPMYDMAYKMAMGNIKTLASRRMAAVQTFADYGIDEKRLCAKFSVAGIQEITPDHLVVLKGLLTALREEETSPEEAFPVTGLSDGQPRSKSQAVSEKKVTPPDPDQGRPPALDTPALDTPLQEPSSPSTPESGIFLPNKELTRMLRKEALNAGTTLEQLVEKYHRIDNTNYKTILKECKDSALLP